VAEEKDERRRRGVGLFLGLAILTVSVVVGAAFALAANTLPLRLNATATTVVLTAGDTATYNLVLSRGSERGPVDFTATNLPPATTATFSPVRTSGDTTTFTVRTDGDPTDGSFTPPGDYDIVLRATGRAADAGAVVRLKVQGDPMAGPGAPIRLSGSLDTVLRPGHGGVVNVSLTNPNNAAVRVTTVTASLSSLTAPRATAAHPCTLADFELVPYTGPGFMLMPRQTRTLAQLGVPTDQWPQVRMRDTALNQDGCQGATVSFSYGVTGRSG
jgi:hypothetical protein